MPKCMHRIPILFPEHEYHRLRRIAKEQRRSFSSLVREAVKKCYPEGSREDRIAAAREIAEAKLDLPVLSWEEIEEELARIKAKGCFE